MSDGPGHVIYERVEEEEDEEDDDHNDGVAGLMTHVVTNNRSPMATIDIIEDVNPFGMDNARHITAFSAFALMVGSQIGTGIFSSPSQVDQHVASPGTAMMVWVLAGLISWAGAASFAELGASIPRNGGMQEYLKYIYGGPLAFILSWTWIVAVKPSAMAIQSLLFAEYWTNAIFSASHRSVPVDKILAVLSLGVVLLVNSINVETTTRLTNVLVFPKLGTVTLIILLALIAAITGLNSDGEGPSNDWKTKSWFATRQTESGDVQVDWSMLTSWELMGNYVAAFYAGLWAYGGWDQVRSFHRIRCFHRTFSKGSVADRGELGQLGGWRDEEHFSRPTKSHSYCYTDSHLLLSSRQHIILCHPSLEYAGKQRHNSGGMLPRLISPTLSGEAQYIYLVL